MSAMRIKTGSVERVSAQYGIVLLDALVAIVIFSIGVLGMVALQSSAVQLSGAANYRINAAMLADQVIAQMWASDPSQLVTDYVGSGKSSGGTSYETWLSSMDCSSSAHSTGCLPGVSANPPSIQITPVTISDSGNTEYLVKVTVNWQAPNDVGSHSYVSITDIGY
jgi:type IV pilus assembly protein PilV